MRQRHQIKLQVSKGEHLLPIQDDQIGAKCFVRGDQYRNPVIVVTLGSTVDELLRRSGLPTLIYP